MVKIEKDFGLIQPPSGLVIGLPTRGGLVPFEWSLCLALQNYPMNVNRYVCPVKGHPIDIARNKIVRFALENKTKYIWFLDDDVTAPFFAARRLIYDLEMADDDVMIAGGIYPSKTYPVEPVVFRGFGNGPFWKWKKNEVFSYDDLWFGTGCMVIKTELFDLLPEPEHILFKNFDGTEVDLPMWFKTVDIGPEGRDDLGIWQTDDAYFSARVIEAGYKMVADGGVLCHHWDLSVNPPKPYMLSEDSYPMQDLIAEGMIAT